MFSIIKTKNQELMKICYAFAFEENFVKSTFLQILVIDYDNLGWWYLLISDWLDTKIALVPHVIFLLENISFLYIVLIPFVQTVWPFIVDDTSFQLWLID